MAEQRDPHSGAIIFLPSPEQAERHEVGAALVALADFLAAERELPEALGKLIETLRARHAAE